MRVTIPSGMKDHPRVWIRMDMSHPMKQRVLMDRQRQIFQVILCQQTRMSRPLHLQIL